MLSASSSRLSSVADQPSNTNRLMPVSLPPPSGSRVSRMSRPGPLVGSGPVALIFAISRSVVAIVAGSVSRRSYTMGSGTAPGASSRSTCWLPSAVTLARSMG
jgi:hypothetical protein